MTFLLTMAFGTKAFAIDKNTVVLPTDTNVARTNCTLVGVQGNYATDIDAALKRINEIRLEACQNGYPDPNNESRSLTMSDYVPLKWSSDLEYIARIRAAEASILAQHARPNGLHWGNLISPNGVSAWGEILAWQSWDGTLVDAINNWYTEKNTWVTHGNGVTGHYTQMIDPYARYTGIATFNSPTGCWYSSSAGKFAEYDKMDSTPMTGSNNCLQMIDVLSDYLSTAYLKEEKQADDWYYWWDDASTKDIAIGDTKKYDLVMDANYGDVAQVYVLGKIKWSSSNTQVATVDDYGTVTFVGKGNVTITAVDEKGGRASVDLSVTGTKPTNNNDSGNNNNSWNDDWWNDDSSNNTSSNGTVKPNTNGYTPGTNHSNNANDTVTVSKTTISSLKAGKKKLTLKWKRCSGSGYEIQYTTKKSFSSNVKSKMITNSSTTKKTIKNLKSKKTYYVRVRTIRNVNGDTYVSQWSKVKKVKVK